MSNQIQMTKIQNYCKYEIRISKSETNSNNQNYKFSHAGSIVRVLTDEAVEPKCRCYSWAP